ncbi:putative HAT dimerization domain, ribonuclease H-like domain-containing protein [Rosa chinensis]|uniref:Putative HAT dimerization domain, ribonuclease H-like domain-containing protein n=1 Tax=Rosa chinensis TaxID=74649 RepID=A0A2P6RZQ8_ROSCH|nr:putative HAT dimerization domain, ribonuclease H-like domain-containing protein [Rosa chinensis]
MLFVFSQFRDVLLEVTTESQNQAIQKEILQVIASKVRKKIREDVGDSKFCIIVDEARDESKREQMALVLRFVDGEGFIQERFFDLSHVKDTGAATLKNEICVILSRHSLDVQNIRGQGYDGASNMRGEWKGLQALFLNDCPYTYYVHCFAHRLQLALVAASREVIPVHNFFSHLSFVINVVVSSCKCHDELQDAQIEEIAHLLSIDELESGKGANQIGTLKRPSDTRWSSYFLSLCSLVRLFGPTIAVLEKIEKESSNYCQLGDANAACKMVTSFEFIFILHLMKEIMGITNGLCQALQQKNQDILNAMHLVSDTKALIQKFREDGWENFLGKVISFSNKYEIDIPDLNAPYFEGRSRRRKRDVTLEHHFHVDIFVAAIDVQLQELNCRFGESAMELLTLGSALEPKNAYKSFNIETICLLVEKYYPLDFTEQEKINLRFQLRSFEIDVHSHPELQSLSSIPQLCRRLVETERVSRYYLIDRLIRFILTLPVSTATSERAFSAMKIIKTRLRNKMEDDFLADNLAVYIEREIAKSFNSDSILDGFSSIKERRVLFK